MENLIEDLITNILNILPTKDKLNLMIICTYFNEFKYKIFFNHIVDYDKIKKLSYYDQFTNLLLKNIQKLPKYTTQLTFGNKFNKDIKNCIPNSVTYLTFGDNFNKNI